MQRNAVKGVMLRAARFMVSARHAMCARYSSVNTLKQEVVVASTSSKKQ